MLCIISLYINILFKLIICLYICIYLCIFVYLCICVYICVHCCIFVYISVYSHLSSKDAPRDLRQKIRPNQRQFSIFPTQSRWNWSFPPSKKMFGWVGMAFHKFSVTFTNFPKFSKIFICSKTPKIDICWLLAFTVTPRTHQKLIFWWIFTISKISKVSNSPKIDRGAPSAVCRVKEVGGSGGSP